MSGHRILLVTYPAQGHINPSLQFANRLISMGAHVTLPITLHFYRRLTLHNSSITTIHNLSLVPFSDGYDDGFIANNHADEAEDFNLYSLQFNSRGSNFVTNLILSAKQESQPFTCLIYTLLLPWAPRVARGFNLRSAQLWVEPATMFDILYHYFHRYSNQITDENKTTIEIPGLPFTLSPCDIPIFLFLSSPRLLYFVFLYFQEDFHELDVETNPIILVNTFEALEPEALRAVGIINNLKMIPIGPLIPSDTSFRGDLLQVSSDYVEWLNSKPNSSVVYVSFGSYFVLSERQTNEIAHALLDCGFSFLWVLREKEDDLKFRAELEEKGKIVKWCSQMEVLSHSSLGCFVTHCGWNSTLESLVSGVPMVAFPQWTDQKTNAKLVEDVWKIGVRVDGKVNEDGIVGREEIRKCLEVVMGNGEKGKELRRNAEKWKELAREAGKEGGPAEKNLRAFLDDMLEENA